MNIWIVNSCEPLPGIDINERLLRYGILSNMLLSTGRFNITWWSSTFSHNKKKYRDKHCEFINISDNFNIVLLPTIGYLKNISFRRILNHKILAINLKNKIYNEKINKPDIILCSVPTIDLSYQAILYGLKFKIPTVVDLRDMWPDIFVREIPRFIRKFGRALLCREFNKMKFICRHATAIIGITEEFVNWGLNYANREKNNEKDQCFPLAYCRFLPARSEYDEAGEFWRSVGFEPNKKKFIITFVGVFSNSFDFNPIIEAAKCLGEEYQFILAGIGDQLFNIKKQASEVFNVIMPGYINKNQLYFLLSNSMVGISPYLSLDDFTISIPNKPIEYMAYGLPVINSLSGKLESFLLENDCGLTYKTTGQVCDILKNFKQNPEFYNKISNNAKDTFNKNFDANLVYVKMAEYLEKIGSEH